jgi:hypothetical protein
VSTREPSDKQLRRAGEFLFARSGSNPASRAAETDLPIVLQITSSDINDGAPDFNFHRPRWQYKRATPAKPNRPRDIIDAETTRIAAT